MGPRDPRIDAYTANGAPFARPILNHLRKVVHAGCPEVEETLKAPRPTRRRRIETAVAWITQGRERNWKYVAR